MIRPPVSLLGARLQQLPHAVPALAEALLYQAQQQPLCVVVGRPALLPALRSAHLPSLTVVGAGPLLQAAHPALTTISLDQDGLHLLQEGELSPVSSLEQLKETLNK